MNADFWSAVVEPICNIGEAFRSGHYSGCDAALNDLKLPKASGAKTVFVATYGARSHERDYLSLLREDGLRPCENAPCYLCGLMAQVPESGMPEKLRDIYIVAAEPDNPGSIIRIDAPAFLFVKRLRMPAEQDPELAGLPGFSTDRQLLQIGINSILGNYWGFLAEKV